MKPEQLDVENMRALVMPHIRGGSEGWYWEDVLVTYAQQCLEVPAASDGTERITVRGLRESATIRGTASAKWNEAIADAGERIRAAENPHPNDYHHSNYRTMEQQMALARRMVGELFAAAERVGLKPRESAG